MSTTRRLLKGYDFFSHQPYLEHNNFYTTYRPVQGDMLNGIVWEAYQVDHFDSKKHIAFPDICADIMTLYTKDKTYCYFMGGTENTRSMKDLDFFDDVETICGIKFCSGMLGNIFTEHLCDAAGSTMEAEYVMYNGHSVFNDLKSAETFDERVYILTNYVVGRLQDGYEVDLLSSYVTNRIVNSHGIIKMLDLAEETGYTDRYIRKVMSQKLGMKLKTFSQVVQMQWSYHLGKEEKLRCFNMADLAQFCGYYDQSHMNTTYKKLTGMLPKDALNLYADLY
mgnify:CR=1 FL=1